jgi:hypothetical protein
MAFTVPTFNLTCNVYTNPWPPTAPRLAAQACALAAGRIMRQWSNGYSPEQVLGMYVSLLLPALTDIRDSANASDWDIVECPAGTGRWYYVVQVEDVGKGYPNEYRLALLNKIQQSVDPVLFAGVFWPTPIP